MEGRLRDVGLLLELSIAAQTTAELLGPRGLERLSRDIFRRVNAFLADQGADPLRHVAIQDFWYARP
jgi:flagellar basal body-associated protein FliL